jgi:hypothetical protein
MEQGRGGALHWGAVVGPLVYLTGSSMTLRPNWSGTPSNPDYTDAEITYIDQSPLWLILVLFRVTARMTDDSLEDDIRSA